MGHAVMSPDEAEAFGALAKRVALLEEQLAAASKVLEGFAELAEAVELALQGVEDGPDGGGIEDRRAAFEAAALERLMGSS